MPQNCIPKCEICGAEIPSPPDALMGWDGKRPIYLCLEHQNLYNGNGFSICIRCRRHIPNNVAWFNEDGALCPKCLKEIQEHERRKAIPSTRA